MLRTSLTSCVTLGPTSLAPMRMTMLLGVRSPGLDGALPGAAGWVPACVRFFTRRFAMSPQFGGVYEVLSRPHHLRYLGGLATISRISMSAKSDAAKIWLFGSIRRNVARASKPGRVIGRRKRQSASNEQYLLHTYLTDSNVRHRRVAG